MTGEVEEKEHVIDCCLRLFIKQGIRSVSIEDIVRSCNISKKSLYELFGNKEGIIRESLAFDCKSHNSVFDRVSQEASNAVEEMFLIQTYFSNRFKNLNPALIFDLTKYYNSIFRNSQFEKQAAAIQFVSDNIERGVAQGLYRKNLPKKIIAKLWLAKIGMIRDQEVFPVREFPMPEITKHLVELHLRSIANEKGVAVIDHHIKQEA